MTNLSAGDKILITADGGARGNPGPAASGYTINGKGYAEYLGETTNNVAEYSAVVFALKKAIANFGKARAKKAIVEVRTDSELLCKQLQGKYKVLKPELQKLFIEVWNLKQDFVEVTFIHIPREENKEADAMVNEALDRAEQKGML